MKYDILNLSKIFEDFIDKHKEIDEIADAHNRNSISFDQMENSKTGKAAEADLIIGIGRNSNTDTENKIRTLCVSKNKINGYHGEPVCTIRRSISRYEV